MQTLPARRSPPVRRDLHGAARIEDVVHGIVERRMRARGAQVTVIPYAGYGAPGWVRVLARVLLTPLDPRRRNREETVRGWRDFATLPVKNTVVTITAGGRTHEARTDRGGFVDCVVEADLAPGLRSVRLAPEGAGPVDAPVHVVGPDVRFGIVSDIDDTVMVTALPRPLLAAWNTFVLTTDARAAVAGMAVLYERLARAHPEAPVLYLSTGAWNVAPTLTRFLARHLYPPGPLLLTDWGPTPERWFRSGPEHKRSSLARLAREFPDVKWLLIGDDGQHDPQLYAEFADAHPDSVAGVAIRRLSPTQAVLAGGLPIPAGDPGTSREDGHRWMWAPDGAGLWQLLHDADLV